MLSECEQFPEGTRKRAICEGTAALPEGKINAYRSAWGLAELAVFPSVNRAPVVHPGTSTVRKPVPARKGVSCGCGIRKPKPSGPGTELLAIMKKKGVPSCQSCKDAAADMNRWGVDGCRERLSVIVEEILPRARDWVAKERQWIHKLLPDVVEDAGIRIALTSYVTTAIDRADRQKRTSVRLRENVFRPKLKSRMVEWPDSPPPIVTIQPAIRTAYRRHPTLTDTINSLTTAGFQSPLIFAEPDAPKLTDEALRYGKQLKPFRAFIAMSEWLLEHSDADWFLLCEDDAQFRDGAADLVRTYPMGPRQVLSLYVSTQQQKTIGGDGFAAVTGDLHGSLSYLVHRDTLSKILQSKTFRDWSATDRVDRAFSQAVTEIGCELVTHNPSLVQHTGDTSTINRSRKLSPGRLSHFVKSRHESPLLTLITPTGDRPEAFSLVERWIANQRYTGPIEWLVIDDGASPTECTMGQRYVRLQPSSGHTLCANLRAALPLIAGQNILIIEDDEYYGPDYLSTMAGQLQHADLVGERASKYYFVNERKWMQYPDWHHVALCRMGLTRKVLGTLTDAITGTDHRSVDERIWNTWKGSRRVWIDAIGNMRLGVGIKGMPGRECGVPIAPRHAMDDHDGTKLQQMLGHDADVYLMTQGPS